MDNIKTISYIQEQWFNKTGVFTAILAWTLLALSIISTIGVEKPYSIGLLIIPNILIVIFWYKSRSVPKNKKGKVGFVVSISCSDKDGFDRVHEDFILPMRKLLKSGNSGSTFHFMEMPQHIAKNIIDIDDAQELRIKSQSQFVLYGNVKVREQEDKKKAYFFDLDGVVSHRPIDQSVRKQFSNEFSELLPKDVVISSENDLLAFKITSEWAEVVIKYVIGIAAAISGDLDYAEALYVDCLERLKNKDETFTIYNKLKERIPIRISELYETRAAIAHYNWSETNNENDIIRLGKFLDKIIEARKNNPKLLGLQAIYQFLQHRNVDEAITLFKRSRDKDISAWHYNIAFLYAYKKDLKTATREYRKAVSFPIDIAVITQVEGFICWLLKVEPEKYQLYYCLGFFNWKAKGDKLQAVKDFQKFLDSGKTSEYVKERELSKKWIKEIGIR